MEKTLEKITNEIDLLVEKNAKECGLKKGDANYKTFEAAYLKTKIAISIYCNEIELNQFGNLNVCEKK